MRVFVTGATGWVGSAVVEELIGAGHQVIGLVRSDAKSDAKAAALAATGAQVHRGALEDLDSLHSGAAAADAVIHTAFNHDFSKIAENGEVERRAIETLGAALEGSSRLLLVTSGVALLSPGRIATEADGLQPNSRFPRNPEAAVAAIAARGVRVSVVRLAPTVHGHGDHGFVPILIGIARDKAASAYIGEGHNRWPAVHRLDAARLYRLALEHGATDARYHAVAEEGVPFKDIAGAIGRGLDVPVLAKSAEQAPGHFGWFGMFAGLDCPASSTSTRAHLGWEPKHPGLIADLDHPGYFKT